MEEPLEKNTAPATELKRLRTFQSDVEELLKKDNVSLSNIALAENKKKRSNPVKPFIFSAPEPPLPRAESIIRLAPFKRTSEGGTLAAEAPVRQYALWAGFIALALLLIGGGIFMFRAWQSAPTPTPVAAVEIKGTYVITVNEKETRAGFIKKIRDGIDRMPITMNEIKPFVIRAGAVAVTTPLFFERLGARAPAALLRAFDATPVFGIHAVRGTQLFLLFPVLSFDNAFDGMLNFEKTALDDMGLLFGINPRAISSATTTKDVLSTTLSFKDTVIKNRDARAIFDQSGKIIFLYSFVDAQTLLMTTNEDTLKALIGRGVSKGKLR